MRRTFHGMKRSNNAGFYGWDVGTSDWRTEKKVAVMKMDMIIKWMEVKIHDMEKMIKMKKEAIANVRKVQEMIKECKC